MSQWILDRWLAYARVSLMLAVFLAPVIFWRGTVDVFNLVKMTVLLVAGAAALMFWISWSAESRRWLPRFNLLYPALGFLLAGFLATVLSENPMLSLTGLYHRYGGLIPFALYIGLMILIVGMYWERPLALRDIAKASAWASVIMTGYTLIQAAGLDWIPWRDSAGNPPVYPVSTMGNSNFAGGYLGIAIPFLIHMTIKAKTDFVRYLLIFAVGADLLALWLTQTRGGMIAAGAGIATMIFLYRDRLPKWTKVTAAVVAASAVLVAVLLLADVGAVRSTPLGRIEVLRTGTFNIRTYYWGTAWRIFQDNPIVGTGLDTYFANYPAYRLEEDGAVLGLTITDKPHNIFLEYASNAGILGAGTYLFTVGLGIWYGLRRIRRSEPEEKLLLATFLAVLVGYLAQGVFSIDVPPLAVMGWIALGGIAAISDPPVVRARERLMAERQEVEKRTKRKSKSMPRQSQSQQAGPLRWPIHAVSVIAVALLIVFGMRPLMADAQAKNAESRLRQSRPDEARDLYEEAVRLHPLEATYHAQLGTIAERLAVQTQEAKEKERLFRVALGKFEDAYKLQPENIFYMMNLGRIYAQWASIDPSKFAESDKWWRRAAEHDPQDWEVHNRYAMMLNDWANASGGDKEIRSKIVQRLRIVVGLRPGELSAWVNLAKVHLSLEERDKAKEAAEKALELDPKNEEARGVLASLATS